MGPGRKPDWLKVKVPQGERFNWIRNRARALNLHTVCEEARCPNIGECWQGGTATFMLMGDACTRGCRFCSVNTARNPPPLDPAEPGNVADTIAQMELDYVVLTSVNRDDLPDQGAGHFAETVRLTGQVSPSLLIEVLIPDFMGVMKHVDTVIEAGPAVIAHNLETVERLTPHVRDPRATYSQSLDVLRHIRSRCGQHAPASPSGSAATAPAKTKSSLMLGFGENENEVLQAMSDLRTVGVDFLTIGQYLQPGRRKLAVAEFVAPERFKALELAGLEMGFAYVASGPLVRSSYRAAEFYISRSLREAGVGG